jgi:hypothetical protein
MVRQQVVRSRAAVVTLRVQQGKELFYSDTLQRIPSPPPGMRCSAVLSGGRGSACVGSEGSGSVSSTAAVEATAVGV